MAVPITEIRPGMGIKIDRDLFIVENYEHVKMAQRAWVKLKIRNLRTGSAYERSFNVDEKVEKIFLERKPMQYLFSSRDEYTFMDQTSYEQVTMKREQLGEAPNYIKEGETIIVTFYEHEPVGVELPTAVQLKVIQTGPSFRGNSVSNTMKPAILETGIEVLVPLFIEENDQVKIDTRTGKYLERA